jgi:hypothetical protein
VTGPVISSDRGSAEQRNVGALAVYSALYDAVQDAARTHNTSVILPRDAFLQNTLQHPNCVDGKLLEPLSDENYLHAIYWSMLNRVPDDSAISIWLAHAARKPGAVFRKKLSRRIAASLEAHTKGVMFLSSAPDGITSKIDIREIVKNSMPPYAYILFFLKDRVLDRSIGLLYIAYSHTLRPYRIKLRDQIRARRDLRSGGGK